MIDSMVVDASVALKWLLPERDSEQAATLVDRTLWSPDIMLVECGSGLWSRARRNLLTDQDARALMRDLRRVSITWARTEDLAEDAFAIALDLGHPIYDCIYLALAEREGVPVVTADSKFALSARNGRSNPKSPVLMLADVAAKA